MTGRAHLKHEITIKSDLNSVLLALTTQKGLKGWHTGQVDGSGEVGNQWVMHFEGKPDFVWNIDSSTTNIVSWTCDSGPGSSRGTKAEYKLIDLADGRTKVELVHSGWDENEANYAKCNTLWGALMHSLKDYVESTRSVPASN